MEVSPLCYFISISKPYLWIPRSTATVKFSSPSPVRINDTFLLAQNTTEMSGTLVEMMKREEQESDGGGDGSDGNAGISELDDLRYLRLYRPLATQKYGSCQHHVNDKQYLQRVGCHIRQRRRASWDGVSSWSLGYLSRSGIKKIFLGHTCGKD